ncbi:hypothetical protein DV737_g2177, partial [Chaetothyriales sp. CBS 132003]
MSGPVARLAGINVGAAPVQPRGDFGLIGLAVMGQNLILNAADHGYTVVAFNRTVSKVDRFLANEAKGKSIVGANSIEDFVSKLKKPRLIMLLVMAGPAVDDFIEKLLPYTEKGDIIIDGGNSHFPDSTRRTKYLREKGIRFVGAGVSGGEEGARYGPSLMPGGNEEAWPYIKNIFQDISAKSDGEACCDWVGDDGAGHYVKMVHNGIEYGDMQLISEAYDVMKRGLGMSYDEMSEEFGKWNKGVLDSFLIEITRDVLAYKDKDGEPLVEKILDSAGQKGTGKWTAINALDLGMPVTLIGEAVFARCLSSLKQERVRASKVLSGPTASKFSGDKAKFLKNLEQALYASKIISYAQGFMLIQNAAKEYGWKLNKPSIALMWRGGCIIRSVFLKDITAAYRADPDLENLLFSDFFKKAIHDAQEGWRDVVAWAAKSGIPTPAFSTALAFFDGYRTKDLPANLLQAQRDYFGAHTFLIKPEYATADRPEGQYTHVNWTGRGGNVSASTYNAPQSIIGLSADLGSRRRAPPRGFPTRPGLEKQALDCRNCALGLNCAPDMASKTPAPKVPVVLPKKDDPAGWSAQMSHGEVLKAVIGSKVRVFTNFSPQQPIEGYLHTADDTLNWIILWHPTAFRDSPASSTASVPVNIPTAANPLPPAQGGIKIILFSHIQSFTVLALPNAPVEPADPSQASMRIDPTAGQQRLANNVAQAQAAEARRGPKGTSPSDQALFEAISRLLRARWEGNQMVISDQYAIEKPYKASNVRLVDERGGVGRSGLDRIKTMVDMERHKILLRMGVDVNEAGSVTKGG